MEGEGVSEDKSQWSSCEIILSAGVPSNQDQDKKEERGPEVDSGFSGLQEVEQSLLQIPVSPHIHTQIWPPAEVQHLEQASWSPRVPPPIPQADPSASALRSLLTSLQQQIVRQRDEYERRITSLEQRNEDLRAEVVRLKTNLTQQRDWYQVVEAKIVESERARAAAELHNATLQREMEQFFDTFGELNKEAKKTEYIVKSF
ncbi:uncharacterized protein LOC103391024 [Cynoglossus semilaevis]|uniref:uncharacterized protein LOC103391024 n=1 Tax=Cynoglossus semilaevis TaxID=244447 RepID=UPI000496D898|nr:uncharacterized protein LOC103391024 [Cynoglossus semilaevis]